MRKSKSGLGFCWVMAVSFGRPTTDLCCQLPSAGSAHHCRRLTEQDLALFVGVDAGRLAQFGADRLALDHRGALADRLFEPAFEMGEVLQLLAEVLEAYAPRPDRHVGNGELAGHEGAIAQPLVQH